MENYNQIESQLQFNNLDFVNNPSIDKNWHTTENSEDDEKNYREKCRFCSKEYLSKNVLLKHEKRCTKNFNSKAKENVNNMFNCKECNQSFRYESGLERHMKRHIGDGGFICRQCGEKFRTDIERKIHKSVHSIIKCQLCNLVFKKDEEFYNHVNQEHDGRDRVYSVCSDCGQQFRTNIQLKYHTDSKCGTLKQWACNNCDSKFMNKNSLSAHQLIHLGEKKHLCNYCGHSFLSKGQLKVHERRHTGEKPFSCETCGKSFAYRESLVTHSSVHTGIKPYLCLACGARFSCIGNLIKHRRTRLDTCGLPQYCKESVKVAPRPSAKRIKARKLKNNLKINIDIKLDVNNSNIRKDKSSENSLKNNLFPININVKLDKTNRDEKRQSNHKFESDNKYNDENNIKERFKMKSNQFKEEKNQNYELLSLQNDTSNVINGTKKEKNMNNENSDSNEQLDCLEDCNYNNDSDIESQDNLDSEENQNNDSDLFYPTESKNGRPLYSCKFCLREYAYLSALEKHEKSHGGTLGTLSTIKNKMTKSKHNYSCKYCTKTYLLKSVLLKHEKKHGPDGSLMVRCACCSLFFSDTTSCLQHQAEMHKDKLACTLCAKIFKRPDLLSLHIKKEHSTEPIIKKKYEYICSICGKILPSKRVLADHEILHEDNSKLNIMQNLDNAHKCMHCERVYSSASSLRSHMTVHATGCDKLQQLCRYCGKAFRTRGEVKVHERGHSGERPYQCEFCAKAFAYRESLITHRSIHTGFKRHACSVCGARFSCVSNLQAHRRSRKNTCGSGMSNGKNNSDYSQNGSSQNGPFPI